ncbi:helix-turn-helix domain-containing protein [Burkholderia gladioli]|uniref:helix-turn-helix domain-containing protein n=1 Tax=Burkholderia gladioli TaxID=28095 RepID=UPI00163E7887|nr:helix-turn-helix domain-containing protein [Burkholderia gladioli]
MTTAEPWVSVEHIAEHLGVVKDTVYRWRERRGLPAHRVGRLWKFKVSEVDAWVRAGGADDANDATSAKK